MIATTLAVTFGVLLLVACFEIDFWRERAETAERKTRDAEQRADHADHELLSMILGKSRSDVSIDRELSTFFMDVDSLRVTEET